LHCRAEYATDPGDFRGCPAERSALGDLHPPPSAQ
jgi:hypothetical protein